MIHLFFLSWDVKNPDQIRHCVRSVKVTIPMFKVTKIPVLNALKLHFATEYRVDYVREHMRVVDSCFKSDLLPLGALGLNIVLPKMSLFFASTGRGTGCV